MGYQKITIVGHLGRNPETKTTSTGKDFTTFSVAVNTGKGEYEHTEWFNCLAWEKRGATIEEYFRKGDPILIEGTLKTREYTAKDGTDKKITELTVTEFSFVGSKKDKERDTSSSGGFQTEPLPERISRNTPVNISEDVPF